MSKSKKQLKKLKKTMWLGITLDDGANTKICVAIKKGKIIDYSWRQSEDQDWIYGQCDMVIKRGQNARVFDNMNQLKIKKGW